MTARSTDSSMLRLGKLLELMASTHDGGGTS